MSKTIIALYNDFEIANQAVEALVKAGIDRNVISVVANDAGEKYSSTLKNSQATDDGDVKAGQGASFGMIVGAIVGIGVALIPGIGPVLAVGPLAAVLFGGIGAAAGAATGGIVAGLVDLGVPEEEAHQYAEGVRRGGALVSVELNQDEQVTRAEEVLNRYKPTNIDEHGETLRQEGWKGFDEKVQPYNENQVNEFRNNSRTVQPGEQQKLNVVEEQVQVGKREVEGGTVRVHSRVTERPVEEKVTLRDEKVTIDRHPVDRAADPAELNTFQEGTLEVTEKHEEAVVSKTARVVEEVVIGKQADEHTETVHETVRRKDVDVEGMDKASTGYADYQTRFRTAYNTKYANQGTWEEYDPAYHFGYDLANKSQYKGSDWKQVEADAKKQWEAKSPNTWDRFKGAVQD
ncbi:MAG: YsnF/AvaK domain-containing protein, partial [Chloroflexota bacterium]